MSPRKLHAIEYFSSLNIKIGKLLGHSWVRDVFFRILPLIMFQAFLDFTDSFVLIIPKVFVIYLYVVLFLSTFKDLH